MKLVIFIAAVIATFMVVNAYPPYNEVQVQQENFWCVWIPRPVKCTLPSCTSYCGGAMQQGQYAVNDNSAAKVNSELLDTLQSLKSDKVAEAEQNNNFWCIWIPKPVKCTLPLCASYCKQDKRVEAQQGENFWCVWIPQPVKCTLPACTSYCNNGGK